MSLSKLYSGRLPQRSEILGLFAVIVFLVYSWMLVASFYRLPSWLYFMTIGQILSVYAYAFSVNLLESLAALAFILLIDLTVFVFLRDMQQFQSRSILLFMVVAGSAILRMINFQDYGDIQRFLDSELAWGLLTFLLAILLSIFLPRFAFVRRVLNLLAERATIFLYLYVSLSLISLLVVLVRNLF